MHSFLWYLSTNPGCALRSASSYDMLCKINCGDVVCNKYFAFFSYLFFSRLDPVTNHTFKHLGYILAASVSFISTFY